MSRPSIYGKRERIRHRRILAEYVRRINAGSADKPHPLAASLDGLIERFYRRDEVTMGLILMAASMYANLGREEEVLAVIQSIDEPHKPILEPSEN